MKRIIRSFATLDENVKELLLGQYPNGIESYHIKSIPTTNGSILKVIELKTEDTMYLIKIDSEVREEIEEYIEEEGSDDDDTVDLDDDDIGDDEDDD